MASKQRIIPAQIITAACAMTIWICGLIGVSTGQAQEQDELRDLKPSAWYKSRAKSAGQSTQDRPLLYKRKTPQVKPVSVTDDAEVGVTIWRLRRSAPSDERQVREMIHSGNGKTEEWTPERIEAMTPIAEGERVRVSIEAVRAGYLYVINRARYTDGTFGRPYLIFPTVRIRGGNNRARPGLTIELPSRTDSPPYFRLQRSRSASGAEEASEELIVLITPQALPGIEAEPDRIILTESQVARWQQQWGAATERWEMVDGAGKVYTKQEKEAADGKRELIQDDPYPQTIYRLDARSGNPLMLTVELPIGK